VADPGYSELPKYRSQHAGQKNCSSPLELVQYDRRLCRRQHEARRYVVSSSPTVAASLAKRQPYETRAEPLRAPM